MSSLRRTTVQFRSLLPFFLSMILLVGATIPGSAQTNNHLTWKLLTPTVTGKPGDKVDVKVQINLVPHAHMYTEKKYPADELGPSSAEVTVGGSPIIKKIGSTKGNRGLINKPDPNFDSLVTQFWEGNVTLSVPVQIVKTAKPGESKAWVNFYYQTCDENSCKPPMDQKFEFTMKVEEDTLAQVDTTATDADTIQGFAGATGSIRIWYDSTATGAVTGSDGGEDTAGAASTGNATASVDERDGSLNDTIAEKRADGLLAYILFAMGFGFLALATPCVFPMIPITISFFTKREQKSRGQAVLDASVYALGIILTFTLFGVIVSGFFGATEVGAMATNPVINLLIAGIYITFALSLFGLFDIQLPSSILNRLNAKANQGRGMSSILMMGFVFSLTSFTCTVPFVGTALAGVDKGDWFYPIIGMVAFATAFSVPFFLFALFPSWMKALPKSGGWLNAVKVTMGFAEIAIAMKFFSNADLVWDWGVLTREAVLAVWVAVAILTSLYLLGRFRLPHDSPIEKIGVLRMLISMAFLATGFWFLTGLFGAPLGEMDALLPPQEYPGKGNTSLVAAIGREFNNGSGSMVAQKGGLNEGIDSNQVISEGLVWYKDDFKAALAESKKTGKPIFVDFTGYTCTNCRWMERNVFTRDEVRELMSKYVLARLYTDRREESNRVNREMQFERFQTIDLPYYVVINPNDKVIGESVFTRDVEKFMGFLQRGIENGSMVENQKEVTEPSEVDELATR